MNLKKVINKLPFLRPKPISSTEIKFAFADFFCASSNSTSSLNYFMNKYGYKKLERTDPTQPSYFYATLEDIRKSLIHFQREEDVGQMQPYTEETIGINRHDVVAHFSDFFSSSTKYQELSSLASHYKIKSLKIQHQVYYQCSMEEMESYVRKMKSKVDSMLTIKQLHSHFEHDITLGSFRNLIKKCEIKSEFLLNKYYFNLSAVTEIRDILQEKIKAKETIEELKCQNFEKVNTAVEEYNKQAQSLAESIQESKQYSKDDFYKEYISDENAINIFQISKRTLYRATIKHGITFLKIGATRYFKKDVLFKALEQKHKPRKNNPPTPQQELDLKDSNPVATETKETTSPFANFPQPSPSDKLINFPCNEDMDYIECCYFLKVTRCTFKKLRLQFNVKPTMIDSRGRYFYKKSDIEDLLFKMLEQKIDLDPKRAMLWSTSTNYYSWSRLSVAEAFDKHQTITIPPSTLSEYKARNKNIDRREKNIVSDISEGAPDVAYEISLNENTLDDVRESRKSEGGGSIWYGKIFTDDYNWSYHNDKPMNNWILKYVSDDGLLCTFSKDNAMVKVKTSSLCARNQEDIVLYVNF